MFDFSHRRLYFHLWQQLSVTQPVFLWTEIGLPCTCTPEQLQPLVNVPYSWPAGPSFVEEKIEYSLFSFSPWPSCWCCQQGGQLVPVANGILWYGLRPPTHFIYVTDQPIDRNSTWIGISNLESKWQPVFYYLSLVYELDAVFEPSCRVIWYKKSPDMKLLEMGGRGRECREGMFLWT